MAKGKAYSELDYVFFDGKFYHWRGDQGWRTGPKNGQTRLHRDVWVKHHGAIPRTMAIGFIDGNPHNCELSNLRLQLRWNGAARRGRKLRLRVKRRWKAAEEERLLSLRSQGLSYSEIADQLGVSRGKVAGKLRRLTGKSSIA